MHFVQIAEFDWLPLQHRVNFRKNIKQVAQRATIAHLSPMCQGQISFQKNI